MTPELVLKPITPVRLTMFLVACPLWAVAIYAGSQPDGILPAIFIATLGLGLWLFVETLRIVLTSSALEYRQFWMTRWRVRRQDVELREGRSGDFGGFPAAVVFDRSKHKKVGALSYMQFRRSEIEALKSALA